MYDLIPHRDWTDAYATYGAELASFVAARVEGSDAEDLLQDIWTALATALEAGEIGQPRAWLYRVARNRITDYYRTRASRPAFLDLTEAGDAPYEPAALPYGYSLTEQIEAALDLVPDKQREVFVRNAIDGETLREIAEDLGVPLKTVISRKGYARQRLQDLLRDLYEEYFGEE